MEHHRLRGDRLVCQKCRHSGMTTRDATRHRCDACSQELGRSFFDGQRLLNKRKKENAGQSYTLICADCDEREKDILAKLTVVKGERQVARVCSCKHRQPLGHEESVDSIRTGTQAITKSHCRTYASLGSVLHM